MRQTLKCARLIMVIATMSPLFAIWAIKGSNYIDDVFLLPFCIICIVLPNIVLILRIYVAKRSNITRKITITRATNQNNNLLLYLFAMLIPLITGDIDSCRDFATMIGALFFLVFLFWHLNLFYLNIVFAFFGYKMFTIEPNENGTRFIPFVVLTKRYLVETGVTLDTWRISDTVFIEREP